MRINIILSNQRYKLKWFNTSYNIVFASECRADDVVLAHRVLISGMIYDYPAERVSKVRPDIIPHIKPNYSVEYEMSWEEYAACMVYSGELNIIPGEQSYDKIQLNRTSIKDFKSFYRYYSDISTRRCTPNEIMVYFMCAALSEWGEQSLTSFLTHFNDAMRLDKIEDILNLDHLTTDNR